MLSIRSECLGKMIFFSEAALRRAISEYAAHYHEERDHPTPRGEVYLPWRAVRRRPKCCMMASAEFANGAGYPPAGS